MPALGDRDVKVAYTAEPPVAPMPLTNAKDTSPELENNPKADAKPYLKDFVSSALCGGDAGGTCDGFIVQVEKDRISLPG